MLPLEHGILALLNGILKNSAMEAPACKETGRFETPGHGEGKTIKDRGPQTPSSLVLGLRRPPRRTPGGIPEGPRHLPRRRGVRAAVVAARGRRSPEQSSTRHDSDDAGADDADEGRGGRPEGRGGAPAGR